MPETDPWTIGRLLTWTTDYLQQSGADSPRLDAEVLLAEARGCQRIELYTAFDAAADETTRTAFRELVRRRAEGMPVAYLVGRREFYSLSFRVTPDVLIPRPETEHVVVGLLDLAKSYPVSTSQLHIADVGTGSGIIAVCAARHLAGCRVTAIDVSPAALAVAESNARQHEVLERIDLVQSDLLSAVGEDVRFDFIASNPPYLSSEEIEALAPDVKQHEPHLALAAGSHGTQIIERLIPQAAEHLKPGGWLIMEISPMLQGTVEAMLTRDGRFQIAPTQKDLAGHARVVNAQRVREE